MSIFTFLLDTTIQNGYALYRAIRKEDTPYTPFTDSKKRVAEAMVSSAIAHCKMRITVRGELSSVRGGEEELELLHSDQANTEHDDGGLKNHMFFDYSW